MKQIVSSRSADTLTINLVPFRDEVQEISRRGKSVLRMMLTEGYPQRRINEEERMIEREFLDARIRTSQAVAEVLLSIVKENGLGR